MRKYDLIISLGARCRTASALKLLKITEKTYPFDWLAYDGSDTPMHLLVKCNLIKNHFENAFNFEDFIEYHNPTNPGNRSVKNLKTDIRFGHDFPWEKSVKDFFPNFLEKYQRRVQRLYKDIDNAKKILFVFEDTNRNLPLKAIKDGIKILKESFPNKDITLLVFLPVLLDNSSEYQEVKLNIDNVICLMCSRIDGNGISYDNEVANLARYLMQFFDKEYYSFAYSEHITSVGLAGKEPAGRWSNDEITFFRLQTKLKSKNVSVSINLRPFVREQRPEQKCKVFCNGHEISDFVFDNPEKQTIDLIVPNDNAGNLDFMFEFDNPVSPKDIGVSNDMRRLSVLFIDAVVSSIKE